MREHEEHLENYQILVSDDHIIYNVKRIGNLIFTNKNPINKKILIWEKTIQNWLFKNSIRIFQGLIEFIEGLNVRKFGFKVQFGL